MNTKIKISSFLLIYVLLITSCNKQKIEPVETKQGINIIPVELNKEYFWNQGWQKTSTGYQISLQINRLTDSAINKGIKVGVAIYSEMTLFDLLPLTLNHTALPQDSINISYSATPGKLNIIAKTSVAIAWTSDVFIYYQP